MSLTLLIVLASSVAVGLLVGVLAKMSPKELASLCGLMCAVALGMYGLVALLG